MFDVTSEENAEALHGTVQEHREVGERFAGTEAVERRWRNAADFGVWFHFCGGERKLEKGTPSHGVRKRMGFGSFFFGTKGLGHFG